MNARVFVVVAAAVALAYLILREQETGAPAASSPANTRAPRTSSSSPRTITKTVTVESPPKIVTRTQTVFQPGATSVVVTTAPAKADAILSQLKVTGLGVAGPTLPSAASTVAHGLAGFVAQGDTGPLLQGNLRDLGAPIAEDVRSLGIPLPTGNKLAPIADKVAGALGGAGDVLGAVGPIGGVFAANLSGLRGASEAKQTAIFGGAWVKAAQFGLGAIPLVGSALGTGLGLLAGTYEGQRAVTNVLGKPTEQVYNAQKALLSGGDPLSPWEGGTTHQERVNALTGAADASLASVKAGSVLTKAQAQQIGIGAAFGFAGRSSGSDAASRAVIVQRLQAGTKIDASTLGALGYGPTVAAQQAAQKTAEQTALKAAGASAKNPVQIQQQADGSFKAVIPQTVAQARVAAAVGGGAAGGPWSPSLQYLQLQGLTNDQAAKVMAAGPLGWSDALARIKTAPATGAASHPNAPTAFSAPRNTVNPGSPFGTNVWSGAA